MLLSLSLIDISLTTHLDFIWKFNVLVIFKKLDKFLYTHFNLKNVLHFMTFSFAVIIWWCFGVKTKRWVGVLGISYHIYYRQNKLITIVLLVLIKILHYFIGALLNKELLHAVSMTVRTSNFSFMFFYISTDLEEVENSPEKPFSGGCR